MKKTSFLLVSLFLVTSFGFISCEQQQREQAETGTETGTDAGTETKQTEGFDAVYNEYLDVKQSLFQDKAEEAQTNAEQLQKEIENSGIENKESLANAASEIAKTTDIEQQRQSFATLSDHFIEVVKNNKGAVDKAFIQHCAMALDNKGARWVSNTKEIQNPYMGQKMPECGSTQDTIK